MPSEVQPRRRPSLGPEGVAGLGLQQTSYCKMRTMTSEENPCPSPCPWNSRPRGVAVSRDAAVNFFWDSHSVCGRNDRGPRAAVRSATESRRNSNTLEYLALRTSRHGVLCRPLTWPSRTIWFKGSTLVEARHGPDHRVHNQRGGAFLWQLLMRAGVIVGGPVVGSPFKSLWTLSPVAVWDAPRRHSRR